MKPDYYQKASKFMKARRYELAIKNFELHLQNNPQDFKALMQQGICFYLSGSQEQFLNISPRIENLISSAGTIPHKIKLMWHKYKSLARKVAATAMITGTMISTGIGCDKSEQKTVQNNNHLETTSEQENKPEAPTIEEKTKNPTEYPAKKNPGSTTVKSEKESDDSDNKEQTNNANKPAVKPMAPASHHRYSAGVYRKKPTLHQTNREQDK